MKKKTLQKLLAFALAATMTVSLAACGGGDGGNGGGESNQGGASAGIEQGGGAAAPSDDGNAKGDETAVSNLVPEVENAYAHSAATKHDSITVAAGGDPGNLLPLDTHVSGKEVLDEIFERLYVIDGFGGELLPAVAQDLPLSAGVDEATGDHMYDIQIRENVYDSDGNNITAADVAFSYDWLVTNSTPHGMGKFHKAEAVDTYTVRFYCDELNGVSDNGSLFAQQWVFSEKAMNDHDFATDPVGSGPYRLSGYTAGSEINLTARDDYWAEGQDYQLSVYCANVQNIRYVIMGEASQQANALRTGELQYSKDVPETDLADFINNGSYASEYGAYPFLDNLTYYLVPNCDPASPCSDVNLRKAILYAVDGATIATASGNSTAEVVYEFYNSKFPETKEEWSTTEDNFYTNPSLETAAEYLAQSSYDGSKIVLATQDAPPACQNVATVIATVLQGIGIDCELQVISASIMGTTSADPEAWDLMIGMMAADDYGVIDIQRLMSKDSYGGGQETINFIVDERLQELIALTTSVEGHTDENIQALHEHLIDNAYGRGLFCTMTYNLVSKDVQNICMNFKYYLVPGGCVYTDNQF